MDSESNGDKETEANVKRLQDVLFPPHIANSGSYFSNFLIKTTQFAEDDDENRIKLKESLSFRELFVTNREANFTLQPARWPTECQVLEEKIEHINYIPPSLESYYPVTGNECQPKPSGEECGVIVYQYQPISAVNYFSRSNVGGSSYLLSSNLCPEEDGLKFESRFESGNLARAIRITPNYYELHLRADLYTNRHMQWFYFRVTNMKKGFLYRFSITNCSKENSLYNEGMRPLMYSKKDSQLHCIGWRRCGLNISYYCNDNVTPEDPDQQMTYTLTFTVEFPHEDDEVYLAHCYPYTYSDLQEFLQELSSHPVKSNYCNVRLLCKSLAGNNVYYVTITSPAIPGENKKKRAVVITARVHPGETPSSWMAKGILEFLSGDSSPAKELRDKFIFKIVPMLNPDGVIVGNNRCSLSAKDLNRQYRTVMRDTYPSIWYTKLMVRRLLEECGVAMYCDLHAHSRKHNIFIYGCENRRGCDKRLQEQVFPLMLHKNTAEKFSFESCKFRIQKAKEGTGRVVMWMMGIANSYTMEASFAGSTLGNRNDTHFNTQDYEQMGRSFCQTLLDFYDDDPRKEKLRNKIVDRLTKEGSNADEPTNIPLSDYSSDEGDTSSSSDEVGRDDEENEIIVPTPPPPSPVLVLKKPKPRSSPNRRVLSRSPCAPRKPLPVNRKYDLELRDYTQEEIDCPELNTDFKESSICWMKQSKPQHVVVASVQAPVKASAFSNIPSLIGECTSKCNEIRKHTLPVFVSNPSQIFANVDSVLEAELNAIEEFKNAQLRNTSDLEQRKDKCDKHSLIEITTSTALPDYSVERSVYLAEFDSNHLKSELKALEKYKIKTDKRVEPKGMAKSLSDLFVLNNGLDLKKFKPSDLDIIDFKTEVQSLRSPRAEVLRSVSFLGQNEPELSSESTNISNSTSNSNSNPKIITLNSIGTQNALEGNNLNYVDETLQHVEVCDRSCGISETPVKKISRFDDDLSNSSKATYFSLICKHFLNNGQSVNIDNEPGKFDKGVNTKSSESNVISKNTQCNINNDNSDIHCTLLATLPRDRSPEICKATIKLSLSEKECLESSSDSDLNTDKLAKEKVKIFRKRRKKKKILKKKPQQPVQDYSDSEVQNMKKSQTQQGISVFDILPTEKLRSQLLTQCSKTPQPKVLSEKKNEITRQLAEVQAKLYTLKNKLWFGVGNGDAPLSWGSGRFYYSSNSRAASPQKFCKKSSKKNSKKQEKADKTVKKESKPKPDAKEKTTKNHNGLRRQAAVEWSVSVDNLKIRKSKSLPDNSAFNLALESKNSNDNDKRDKKNKKKKKPNSNNTGKFAKKVKAVTNAKSFTQKD